MPVMRMLAAFSITVLVAIVLWSWGNCRPDKTLSSLDTLLSDRDGIEGIVAKIEELDFSYTVYEYSQNIFQVISGAKAYSPLSTFPDVPLSLFENCDEIECTVIRSSKMEFVYFLRIIRFHHEYRYLWIFHEGQLVNVSTRMSFWGILY